MIDSEIEMIDKYLQHGGNIIFGASKTGKMKSLFLKLGFWDTGYSDVEKGFENVSSRSRRFKRFRKILNMWEPNLPNGQEKF